MFGALGTRMSDPGRFESGTSDCEHRWVGAVLVKGEIGNQGFEI
jgi:hypothetical protein